MPASALAITHLGRPLPGAALLGGFAALTGAVGLESVVAAISGRFSGPVAEGNAAAARAAFAFRQGRAGGLIREALTRKAQAMLKQIEGSRAVAEAVAMCRPEVICAYPITPQTHIVEALGAMVKNRRLKPPSSSTWSPSSPPCRWPSGRPRPVPAPTPRPPARACST